MNQHKKDFFDYLVKNEKEMKKALKKNVTYDEEVYEDAWGNAIIKVAEYIDKGNTVNDFKNFFFITAKWEYIRLQKLKRAKDKRDVTLSEAWHKYDDDNNEQYYQNINKIFDFVVEKVNEEFSSRQADIYAIYTRLKSTSQKVSYEKLAKIMGLTMREVSTTVKMIKDWVRDNPEINEYKRKLIYND